MQPLRTAARHGHKDAVEALIRAGAEFDFLDLLVAGLTKRVITYLDSHPDAINLRLRNGSPPIHAALDREMQDGATLASILLERGANPSLRDARGRTALHVAIETDNKDAIKILRAPNGELDIFAAAGLAEYKAVLTLIRANPACADEKQADGVTPLFYAAHSGSSDIARALLEAGANPSPRSDRFWACISPLHLAIQRSKLDVARILLDWGADVNAFGSDKDRFQPAPLHVAARWGGIDVVRLLLDHGADPRAADVSALGWVLYAGQADILQLLFDRGLDRRDVNACFALHKAAACGHADLVRLLIANGADKNAKDRDGHTPRDLALAYGKTHLDKLLT
jgi:ankyrin repeat protein